MSACRPDVLLVVCDTLRPDVLSTYGGAVESEAFDVLAKQGTTFERAYAAGPGSSISHAALFSGQYPSTSGVGGQVNISHEVPLLAAHLRDHGYETFGMPGPSRIGSHWGYGRGFNEYLEKWSDIPSGISLENLRLAIEDPGLLVPMPTELIRRARYGDDKYQSYLLDVFERKVRALDTPFCGFINLTTVHSPYDPPRPYKEYATPGLVRPRTGIGELLGGTEYLNRDDIRRKRPYEAQGHEGLPRLRADSSYLSDAELQVMRSWYRASVRYLDDILSEMLSSLRRSGALENTVVVLTADHGEYLGEHDMLQHMYLHFEPCLHVPLVVAGPGVPSGGRRTDYVSLIDVLPTVCNILDLDTPNTVDGHSLFGPLSTRRDAVYAENGPREVTDLYRDYLPADDIDRFERGLKSVRTEDHLYTVDSAGTERLYQLPDETHDENPEEELLAELRGQVHDELGDEFPSGTQSKAYHDDQIEENLRRLGYIQ